MKFSNEIRVSCYRYISKINSFIVSFVFACSVFGEDALVNVSVEKKDDNKGKLAGYIRIRSKTQGIALSLGDRITSIQRGLPSSNATKQ
jgi:coatomer subunit beta